MWYYVKKKYPQNIDLCFAYVGHVINVLVQDLVLKNFTEVSFIF